MRQRIGHTSRLPVVVLAVLVCQGTVAQADSSESCGVPGFLAGQLLVHFEAGTSLILAEFEVHVIRFADLSFGPVYELCVPLGEEYDLIAEFELFSEVNRALRFSFLYAELQVGPNDGRLGPCLDGRVRTAHRQAARARQHERHRAALRRDAGRRPSCYCGDA